MLQFPRASVPAVVLGLPAVVASCTDDKSITPVALIFLGCSGITLLPVHR